MKKQDDMSRYHEYYEYHGNTEVKRTRQKSGDVISRDWLVFDTVEEAMEFFNARCPEIIPLKMPAWMIRDVTSS